MLDDATGRGPVRTSEEVDLRVSDAELIAGTDEDHARSRNAQYRMMVRIGEIDKRRIFRRKGLRDTAEWISASYHESRHTAVRWVRVARRLPLLPHISHAFAEGRLSLAKVIELVRFATPKDDAALAGWAERVKLSSLRRRADLSCRAPAEEHAAAERSRRLEWWRYDDGSAVGIEAHLPVDQGEVVIGAIERLAEEVPVLPDEEGTVVSEDPAEASAPQRRADALYLLASRTLSGKGAPERPVIVVQTDLETLLGGDKASLLNGRPVPPETMERLRCECRLEVVFNKHGVERGIATADYSPTPAIRRQVMHRDGGRCTFPGCGSHYVQTHHIIPWPHGPTKISNLCLLCPFHHRLAHRAGWKVKLGSEPGVTDWFRPDGRPYRPWARARPASAC